MIKRIVAFFFLFVPMAVLQAQPEASQIPYLHGLEIHPAAPLYHLPLPFSGIKIIDSRFDTSKVGYARNGSASIKLLVPGGLQQNVEKILNASLQLKPDTSPRQSLVFVIKNFWLHETNNSENGNNKTVAAESKFFDFSECRAKMELYVEKDSFFIPLLRIDSVFSYHNRLKKDGCSILIIPFEKSLKALEKIDLPGKLLSGKRLRKHELEGFNQQRFTLPVLQPFQMKTGVYRTFRDFVQNKLTPQQIIIESEGMFDHVYVHNGNNKELLADFWGICDGNRLFIRAGFKLYELIRQGKTFDFYGSMIAVKNAKSQSFSFITPGGTPVNISTTRAGGKLQQKDHRAYQLDMETGAVY